MARNMTKSGSSKYKEQELDGWEAYSLASDIANKAEAMIRAEAERLPADIDARVTIFEPTTETEIYEHGENIYEVRVRIHYAD